MENQDKITCNFCGKEGTKETVGEAKENIGRDNALTLLSPDEKWICNKCLKYKCQNKIIK